MWLLPHQLAFRQHQHDSGCGHFASYQFGKHLGVWCCPPAEPDGSHAGKRLLTGLQPLLYLEPIPEVIYVNVFSPFWNAPSPLMQQCRPLMAVLCYQCNIALLHRWRKGRGIFRTKQNKEVTEAVLRNPNYLHMWNRTWSWPRKISQPNKN